MFYSPFRRKRFLLFCFFRDDRVEESIGGHYTSLLGRELDHSGFLRCDLGFHPIMLIVDEAVIGLRVRVDLLQCFLVQLIAGVLSKVLIQRVDDLLFQNGCSPKMLSQEIIT